MPGPVIGRSFMLISMRELSPGLSLARVVPSRSGLSRNGDLRDSLSRRRRSALVRGMEYSEVAVVSMAIPSVMFLKERDRLDM